MVVSVLATSLDKDNFTVLLSRERGSKLIVHEDGKICYMSIVERIRYFFNETFRKEVQDHLKHSISDLIGRVQVDPQNKAQALETTTLFFTKLYFLSEDIYDRATITLNQPLYECLLSTMDVREMESDRANKPDFVEKVKRAKLSLALGITPISGGGMSGSYIIREIAPSEESRFIGIFKPKDEESLSISSKRIMKSLRNIITSLIFFHGSRIKSSLGTSYLAEEGAYRVSEEVKLFVVPRTTSKMCTAVRFGETPTVGSFQEYIHGCVAATEKLGVTRDFRNGRKLTREEISEIEKFIILNFIIGNTDAHAENCLFKGDGEVVAIDGGLAFPVAHPIDFRELRHFNRAPGLASLKSLKFSQVSRLIIYLAYLKKDKLSQIIRNLYKDKEDCKKTEHRIKTMNERIDLLYTCFYQQNNNDISFLLNLSDGKSVSAQLTL